MRSNFAPRLGVQRESVFDVLDRHGRRGRLVGIAHLLDPFGEEVVRSVTSVQPTSQIDDSLVAEGRRVVEEEDPDLLVLQLLAADQLGHVRGVRNPEYLDQIAETDRHVGDFLGFLEERGKLDDATVILMADHGQGRGIGGHGHLDWGERPVPFVVWGEGAPPGTVSREPRSVLELARRRSSALLGVPQPRRRRAAGRWCRRATPRRAGAAPGRRALPRRSWSRATRSRQSAACLPGIPKAACGLPLDVLLVDDGSRDATPVDRPRARRARPLGGALARTRRRPAHRPRDRPRRGLRRRPVHRRRRRVRPGGPRARPRAGGTRTRRLRARLALPRPTRGHVLAPNAREPLVERAAGNSARHRHERCPDRLPRVLRPRARRRPHPARLQLRAGAHALAVGRRHRRGRGADQLPAPHERTLVRALPRVPGPRGARRLARVARRARLARTSAARPPPTAPASQNGQPPPRVEQRQQIGERPERRVGPGGHERAVAPATSA